jgi:pentatricopeptide repeat protein
MKDSRCTRLGAPLLVLSLSSWSGVVTAWTNHFVHNPQRHSSARNPGVAWRGRPSYRVGPLRELVVTDQSFRPTRGVPLHATGSRDGRATQADIEWDEDEYDFDQQKSMDEYRTQFQALAAETSQNPHAVQQAQDLFDELYKAYIMTEDASYWPGTDIYNLLLETHAYSPHKNGAVEAEAIVARMEQQEHGVARPNVATYAKLMEAWTQRKRLDKVTAVWERIAEQGLQPNISTYNKLIKAYGVAGKAEQALQVLEDLLLQHQGKDNNKEEDDQTDAETSTKPTQKTWVQVLRAFASKKYVRNGEGVDQIQALLRRMAQAYRQGEADWKPGVDAYNSLLKAMSYQKGSGKESESVLYGMLEQFREGEEALRPNAGSFYHVLHAYRGDKDAGVSFKVEKLIQLQEALAVERNDPNDPARTTTRVYNAAMAALSRTKDPQKAVRAKRFMDRMNLQHNDPDMRPNEATYTSLLNACAYTTEGEPADKLAAFQISVDALKEIRQSPSISTNSKMFGLFLRGCANLMPHSRKRDAVVESVFASCCDEGYISDYVLEQFERAASEQLQLKVLGGFLVDGVETPAAWRQNVVRE